MFFSLKFLPLIPLLAPLTFANLTVTPVYPLTSIGPDWAETREGAGYDLSLLAPPNGTASAPVVVEGPDSALRDLSFRISDAQGPGGRLGAERFVLRYAGMENQGLDRPIEEFSVLTPDAPDPVGNLQVLWLTVRPPPQQPEGTYRGVIEISGGGHTERVPFTVEVPGFVMPDPYEMITYAYLYQSPEGVAWHYNVPLWSDEHLDLMEPSFRLLGRVGSRHLDLYVYPDQYFGRTSNIPFRNRNGVIEPDFNYAERYLRRYLDIAGPLDSVSLIVWSPQLPVIAGGQGQMPDRLPVSFVDEDGVFTDGDLPMYGPPETRMFWETLIRDTRRMLDGLGLEDTLLTLGVGSDVRANADTVAFFNQVAPDLGWYLLTHGRGDPKPRGDHMQIGNMKVTYYISPFGPFRGSRTRERPALIGGWDNEFRQISSVRFGLLAPWRPLINFRTAAEGSTEAEWRGFTGMGIDFWVVDHPRTGRRESSMIQHGRGWPRMHTNNTRALAAPGPNGALETTRYEMVLEGIQELEARITLERVLSRNALRSQLPRGVAAEIETFLKDRVNGRYALMAQEGRGDYVIWAPAEVAYDQARDLFRYAAQARTILLQAGELSPPTRDAGLRAWPPGPLRTWTDTQGRQVEARMITRSENAVMIRLENGREFLLPLDTLSVTDRAWVEALP
ncbi:MAG: hypothetical protein JJU05_15310 [Verrucomicrobia bacterium]|nr:hypothetical protein [Verrucomicrobiota bacterium]MCH8526755.1 hypothetical protein [Kiritimatiellia bacterium]